MEGCADEIEGLGFNKKKKKKGKKRAAQEESGGGEKKGCIFQLIEISWL